MPGWPSRRSFFRYTPTRLDFTGDVSRQPKQSISHERESESRPSTTVAARTEQSCGSILCGFIRATGFFASKLSYTCLEIMTCILCNILGLFLGVLCTIASYWKSMILGLAFGLVVITLTLNPSEEVRKEDLMFNKETQTTAQIEGAPPAATKKSQQLTDTCSEETSTLDGACAATSGYLRRIEALEQGLASKQLDETLSKRLSQIEATVKALVNRDSRGESTIEIDSFSKELADLRKQGNLDREKIRNLEDRVDAKQKELEHQRKNETEKYKAILRKMEGQLTIITKAIDTQNSSKEELQKQLDTLQKSYEDFVSTSELHSPKQASQANNDRDAALTADVANLKTQITNLNKQLSRLDKDKTGMPDCINTVEDHSEAYIEGWDNVRKMFLINVPYHPPEQTLEPVHRQGDCWAMGGQAGHISYNLIQTASVYKVSIEHIHQEVTHNEKSTPRGFKVYGRRQTESGVMGKVRGAMLLDSRSFSPWQELGDFSYKRMGDAIQYFTINNGNNGQMYDQIRFKILSNYGNEDFTCLYRLRVHGDCIVKATAT